MDQENTSAQPPYVLGQQVYAVHRYSIVKGIISTVNAEIHVSSIAQDGSPKVSGYPEYSYVVTHFDEDGCRMRFGSEEATIYGTREEVIAQIENL